MAKALAQSCAAQSTPKGITNFISTDDLAKDWNTVRDALGYEKMNLLGYS